MAKIPSRIPYDPWKPQGDPADAAAAMEAMLSRRRTVREFSDRPVPQALIESIIRAAGSAPSGANKQPWRFVAVSDLELKRRIREAAEEEEQAFYERRATKEWLDDLRAFETGPDKPFLESAPWLIVVFKLMQDDRPDTSDGVYYVNESVGLACGLLLAAAQAAGLATLTHTPSPMGFLKDLLGRPEYERPFLLIPVGWPTDDCQVPDIERKRLDEIMVIHQAHQSGQG